MRSASRSAFRTFIKPSGEDPGLPGFRITRVLENLLPDDAFRGFVQILPQRFRQLGELWPEDVVHEAGHDQQYDCRPALAVPPEGIQPIAAAQGQEQPQVPPVPQGELHLHRAFLGLKTLEILPDAVPGRHGGHALGTLMGMMADVHEMGQYLDANESDQAGKVAVNAFAHAITEQTFLQGMSTLVKALDAPEKNGEVFMQNLAASAVPATFTQTAALIHEDPYKRQIDSLKDAVMARIPGLREGLTPQRDPWGEPVPNDDRVAGVSPIIAKDQSSDLVRTEAARLGVGVQPAPHSIELPAAHQHDLGKVELTPQQRDVFGDVSGHLAHSIMIGIVNQPGWAAMPAAIQTEVFEKVFEKANQVDKMTAISPEQRQQEMQRIVAEVSKRMSPAASR